MSEWRAWSNESQVIVTINPNGRRITLDFRKLDRSWSSGWLLLISSSTDSLSKHQTH